MVSQSTDHDSYLIATVAGAVGAAMEVGIAGRITLSLMDEK